MARSHSRQTRQHLSQRVWSGSRACVHAVTGLDTVFVAAKAAPLAKRTGGGHYNSTTYKDPMA